MAALNAHTRKHHAGRLVLLALLSACSRTVYTGQLPPFREAPASGSGGPTGAVPTAGAAEEETPPVAGTAAVVETMAIESGTHAEFCSRSGPAVQILSSASAHGGAQGCTPSLGRRLFAYGLCSCSDLTVTFPSSVLWFDGFDSRQRPVTYGESRAALGVNGTLNVPVPGTSLSVSGNAILAGKSQQAISYAPVFGFDLKTNAISTTGTGSVNVGRDLWVDGEIQLSPSSTVGRNVYQTPGHANASPASGGNLEMRSFAVRPPCACGLEAELDVPAIVARAQLANDGAELGLSIETLTERLGRGEVPAAFSCGRFAIGSVSLPGDTLALLSGRVALFVAGDLTINGNFAVDLTPEAELDVFIAGNLIVNGTAQIGTPERPAALRLYVGGAEPIRITNQTTYAAQIYAPHAPVQALVTGVPLFTSTWGSIFAARFDTQFLHTHYYDRAILEAGESCAGSTPSRCDACDQCPGGLTCVEGVCDACRSDADCCDPFVCAGGACEPPN